jgi:putative ABC transport system permease protein
VRDAVIFGHVPGGPGSPTTLTAGRQPAGEGEAVTGEGNGGSGFGLGDRVVVLPDGEPITIVGLARDIDYSVAPTLFAPYGTYLAARRTANPDALGVTPSAVAVAVDDGAEPGAVAQGINAAVPGVEALTRAEAVDRSPGVGAVRQSFLVVTILFYIAIPLIVGLFFVIITVQKAAALTLLRAIGAEGRTLVVALLTQVALVLAAGTAIALGLLAAAGAVLSAADFAVGVGIGAGTALTTLAVVIVLALLASMVAVRRVLATDPIEAAGGQGAGG